MSYRKYLMTDDVPPSELYKTVKIDTDSDTISRKAAIDALTEYGNGRAVFISVGEAVIRIEQLPPAQPKTGKWALQSDDYHEYYECDQCGMAVGLDDVRNFCPNCGADMEVTE